MIKYLIIQNDIICGYSDNEFEGGIPYDFDNSNVTIEEFTQNMRLYTIENGQLVINQEQVILEQQRQKERELQQLRAKREGLFKKYIDRSPMFYNSLTQDQRQELEAWYQTWLEMPEAYENGTWQEPYIPTWLEVIP